MSDHTIVIIRIMKIFFVQFFCVFLPPLLNIFRFCLGPYHFCPLSSPSLHEIFPWYLWFFLKRSLIFPIPLFSSISFHWSLRKAFSSLFAILWNSALKWVYLSFSPFNFMPAITICKERYKHLNAEFQRIAKRDKKAFLSNPCKKIGKNNRMGKTRVSSRKLEIPREHFIQRCAQERTEMVWT